MVTAATAQEICTGFGPQAPRDITSHAGENGRDFNFAPHHSALNLCNIHTHTNAEHKGPGYALFAGANEFGGYKCNASADLTEAQLANPWGDESPMGNAKPGDTIEVHWVFSSCDVAPGPGLGSCLSDACANPQLRVEAQTFLLVNDETAADFRDFAYQGNMSRGYHQPKALPRETGTPVLYQGSTTGPSYTEQKCSPLQVTWSVRPQCAMVDINSLYEWSKDNPFEEKKSHGVRQIVTSTALLSQIK